MKLVTLPCGCKFAGTGERPVITCQDHKYITCANCGGQAEVTPIGVLCLRCTFGRETEEAHADPS